MFWVRAAGKQGGVNLKRRIFGGRANQDYGTILDYGQNGILLGFIKPVDFIDKHDSALAGSLAALACLLHHSA